MAGTGVGKFSSTASNNTSNLTVNFAENMAPSNVNNAARELMGHMRDMYEQLGDGYFEFGDGDGEYTVTRGDADTITITGTGDITSVYYVGRKIRITDGGGNVVEGVISGSSHSSTTQTIDLTGISLASGTPTKVELGIDTAAFGGKVILDDDGDTYIEAPTDDTIDIYVAGAKDFVITANTFTAESGSTIAAQTISAAGNVDFNGDLDVDGTTNLDVVDIDGAVNMATTALVTGVLTTTAATVFNGGFASNAASTITTADNTDTLTLTSTDADATVGPNLVLYRNSASPADSDDIGAIRFDMRNDNSQDFIAAQITGDVGDVSDGTEDAEIHFDIMTAGTLREYLRLSSGNIIFNEGSQDIDFRVESNNGTHRFFVDGGNNVVIVGGNDGSGTVPVPINTNGGTDSVFQLQGANNANEYTMHLMGGIDAQNNPPAILFSKSRSNTLGQHTILENGDRIGEIVFAPADGVDRNSVAAFICADVDGTPGENDTPGRLEFHTTADGANTSTERVRIHNNGVASFNNGIALGVGTANTATNVLDDYEEGTFTYAINGSNSGNLVLRSGYARGEYVKIGNLVHIDLRFETTSDNSIDGNLQWTLPFTKANANASDAGNTTTVGYIRDNALGTNARTGVYIVGQSEAYAQLLFSREGAANSTVELATDANTDGVLEGNISITYRTT